MRLVLRQCHTAACTALRMGALPMLRCMQVLNTWSKSLAKLLDTVERTCQQVQKESMIHKVAIGAA